MINILAVRTTHFREEISGGDELQRLITRTNPGNQSQGTSPCDQNKQRFNRIVPATCTVVYTFKELV